MIFHFVKCQGAHKTKSLLNAGRTSLIMTARNQILLFMALICHGKDYAFLKSIFSYIYVCGEFGNPKTSFIKLVKS